MSLFSVQPAPVSRQEVESILSVQRELLTNAREIKVLVQHNTGGGQQPPQPPQQQHPPQPAQGGSQDGNAQQLHLLQQLLTEVRENMNVVRREFGTLTTRLAGGTGGQTAGLASCPAVSCTSSTTLLLFLAVQSVILVGTLYFLNHRESSQSKKFY